MNSQINETLVRDIITEVLGRLGSPAAASAPTPAARAHACGCSGNGQAARGNPNRGKYGIFQDAAEACEAARAAFVQLQQKGMAARAKIVEIVKAMSEANAAEWGRLELDETKIGRL